MIPITKSSSPSLSAALQKWLESQNLSPLGGQLSVGGKKVSNLWQLFDYCNQIEMAGRVLQGYYLAQIKSTSEDSFAAGLRKREIAHSIAYRLVENYALFNSLPDLGLLGRAARLGSARLRELKPEMGLDGIRALVQGKRVQGLIYDDACAMTKHEIIDWRKRLAVARAQRQMNELKAAGKWRALPDPAPEEPSAATTVREEGIAIGWRMRAEIGLLQVAFAKIPSLDATHPDEPWFRAAALMLDAGLRSVLDDAEALQSALIKRFGASVMNGDAAPTRHDARTASRRKLWVEEVYAAAAERIRERHQRCGWRGRPATSATKPASKRPRGRPRNGA
jgi:hypothetical protein